MPARARLPSGGLVEVLCGQPEQKNGVRLIGVMKAARDAGLDVPRDLSIVGFDDLHSSSCTTPPLTTVRQPLFEVGRCLGQGILKMIAHEPFEVDVPPLALVVRESVRRLG